MFAQVETAGFRRVIICTGFRADQIEEEFRDYSGNLELVFSREEKPLGTAGALGFAARCVQTPQVLVLNGDSFVDTNLCGFTDWYGFHHFDVGRLPRARAMPAALVRWKLKIAVRLLLSARSVDVANLPGLMRGLI